MKIFLLPATLLISALLIAGMEAGCTTQLENGGAYAPGTNSASGVFVPTQAPDPALYVADASYRLAYDAIDGVLKFERDNRAEVAKLSPKVKPALDAIRPTVKDIDHRWALARAAYKVNPIPANLSTLQNVLAEIQRLVPVVQSQLLPPSQ
jgi:hypothetical protein